PADRHERAAAGERSEERLLVRRRDPSLDLREAAIDLGYALAISPLRILDEELELAPVSLIGELPGAHEHVGAHAEQARRAGAPLGPRGLGLCERLQPERV